MNIIKNTVGFWLILFAFTIPFPFYLFEPLFNFPSDSILMYYTAGIVFLIAIGLSILQQAFGLFNQIKLFKFIYTSVAYILSYFLLKYGMDKLLLRQFYTPEPNILFTPIGSLTKDMLYWTTMGSSATYQIFMGTLEIIPALLLVHFKTRILGALCALAVLLNVFVTNLGFDITVKLLSFHLLLASLFLLAPVFKKLWNFLIEQKGVSALDPPQISWKNDRFKRWMKASVLSLILFDVISPYLEKPSTQELNLKKYVGSYENNSKNTTFLNHQIKRVHIHSKGYFIVEDLNSNFYDFKFTIIGNSIYLLKEKTPVQIELNSKTIVWKEHDEQKMIQFKKINKSQIPLLKDEIHWTYE